MKKVLSVLIAISLSFAMVIPAFAGEKVDALTDAQQKEIATLVLDSINKGNDVETAMGRSSIKQDVIAGISDFSPYKIAYRANPDSIKFTVSLAITAVKEDVAFSDSAAGMLTTLISKAIADEVVPAETVTRPSGEDNGNEEDPDTNVDVGTDTQYIVDLLSNLSYEKIRSVLVSLVGNGAITVDEAELIIKALYANGSITHEERNLLLEAIKSDEAQTNVVDNIFEGYTPTDLAQLFRGFGDAINYITSGLADLLRSAGSSNGGSETPDSPDDGSNGGDTTTPSNPTDIPPTGDYAIVSVAGVALAAGLVLVLTRKKKGN